MYTPPIRTLEASSSGIMNAIRANASPGYQNDIPMVDDTTESIQRCGQLIMAYQPHKNEFVQALVNRIALVSVTSRRYANPMRWAKKGVLEYGDTEEEIFVAAAEGTPYHPNGVDLDMFKLYKGDIRSAFHSLNFQDYYAVSINDRELRLAFLSRNGVTDLISRQVESLYSGMEWDEYIMTKYILALLALQGSIYNVAISAQYDEPSLKGSAVQIKRITNAMRFMSGDYNFAGVPTYTDPSKMYFITTGEFDAAFDVNVLASAFNMDKVEFLGRRKMIDSFAFSPLEQTRLAKMLADDPAYVSFTEAQNNLLKSIKGVAVDEAFFRIYDVGPDHFTEQYDAVHLRWNEFLHVWRIYSASPFNNVVMFSSNTPAVTGVNVTGPATLNAGDNAQYIASVQGTGFVPQAVTWSIAAQSGAVGLPNINKDTGALTGTNGTSGKFTITAAAIADSTKTGTLTLTIS